MISDFLETTVLWAMSSGKKKLFVVGVSNLLNVKDVNRYQVINYHGPVSFLECTQLSKCKQSCQRNVIKFRMRIGNDQRLGVVQSIHPMDAVPFAKLFIWTGTPKISGMPTFATGLGFKKWTEIIHHFCLENWR